MPIIGLLRVKNEFRWICAVIRSIQPVCQRIVVLDDHSDDSTARLCEREGAKVIHSPFEGLNEARDKTMLLEWASLAPGDWVLMIDGDEVLHPDDQDVVLADVASRRAQAYSLRIIYLWDRPDQMRVDGVYGHFSRPSLFQYEPGQAFTATAAGGNMHCSSVPKSLLGRGAHSQARLLHYGYMHREDRIRKWHWYRERDPHNSIEAGYVHMVIGDLPEYPATFVSRHGGPLELRPLQGTLCLWCRQGEYEPGAHHAADCQSYRSPFVGPDASKWDSKLREFLASNASR